MAATLVILENDPLQRELMGSLLSAEGHRVLECTDVKEALSFLDGDVTVDVVVADYRLDLGARAELVARSVELKVPTIAMSGDSERDITELLVEPHLTLRKPVDVDGLVVHVQRLLERRQSASAASPKARRNHLDGCGSKDESQKLPSGAFGTR